MVELRRRIAEAIVARSNSCENVLVGEGGVVKVADFGLVRAADAPAALPIAASGRPSIAAVESITRTCDANLGSLCLSRSCT